jgi:ankyrin repeat protein
MVKTKPVMTASERQAIEKASEALSRISIDNPDLLIGSEPLNLVTPHIECLGHSGLVEVVMNLLQRFCGTVRSEAASVFFEPLSATILQLTLPTLERLAGCVISHGTFQNAFSLTPLLHRLALLSAQCCAVVVRDVTSAASVLPFTSAMKMLTEVLTEAVLNRVEHFRPMDSLQLSRAYQGFADFQVEISQPLAAELLGQPEAKRSLAPAPQRQRHNWRNDELRQFWEARCAPKYDDAVPVDALAIFLLRATTVEPSLSNREALMRRLAAIERKMPSSAVLVASEFDQCASEIRRCGGLRAWVNAVISPSGPGAPGIGPLGTKQLAGCVPSLASTWGPSASSNSWQSASTRTPMSASMGATPRGEARKPFALTSASLKSARSARSDNSKGQDLFESVERHSLKVSQKMVLGDKVSVSTRHIAFRDTPLHSAAAQDQKHAPHCRLLLEQGAEPDAEDRHLATPLHVACAAGHAEAAKKLITCGANVCKEDRWKATPLHRAAQNGQTELAALLLQSGAQPGIADEWGATALHKAAAKKQIGIAERLLLNGPEAACINAEDRSGDRPIHVAAKNGDYALVKLLLEHGAQPAARSRVAGKTPEDCARDRGHTDVVTLLQNCGDWIPTPQSAITAVG